MRELIPIIDELLQADFSQLKLCLKNVNFMDLELEYRGEGNENLVFSLLAIKYIIRLRKSETAVDIEKENENLKISFLYQYIIIRLLFTNAFSLIPILVEIPEEKVKWLDNFFLELRPNERQNKHLFYNVAEVLPDLAFFPLYKRYNMMKNSLNLSVAPAPNYFESIFGDEFVNHRNFVFSLLSNATFRQDLASNINSSNFDTICVEIKPKQGWTAESDRFSGICPFCINQYHKFSLQKVSSKSGYCPLDLFSGDSDRMLRALKELIKSPQNNFKIFRNGNFVYGQNCPNHIDRVLCKWLNDEDGERCTNNFCYLIVKILTYEMPNETERIIFAPVANDKDDSNVGSCINVELVEQILTMLKKRCRQDPSSLSDNCILGRILSIQKLDSSGLEVAQNYLVNHLAEYDSDYGYVYGIISRLKFHEQLNAVSLNALEAYLLSTVAKDLSILMSFKRILGDETVSEIVIQDYMERRYEVNISVVDVGPKPVSCLKKHKIRNDSVLKSFTEYYSANLSNYYESQ